MQPPTRPLETLNTITVVGLPTNAPALVSCRLATYLRPPMSGDGVLQKMSLAVAAAAFAAAGWFLGSRASGAALKQLQASDPCHTDSLSTAPIACQSYTCMLRVLGLDLMSLEEDYSVKFTSKHSTSLHSRLGRWSLRLYNHLVCRTRFVASPPLTPVPVGCAGRCAAGAGQPSSRQGRPHQSGAEAEAAQPAACPTGSSVAAVYQCCSW